MIKKTTYILIFSSFLILFNSCGIYEPVDTRERPVKGTDRARQNIEQGRGVTLGGIVEGRSKTNYEFSTSNPMWRASLEILDFLPLTTVDYSGGMIISDWYADGNDSDNTLKISVRFLSNEIQTNSVKIIVHQKTCSKTNRCSVSKISSKIEEELKRSILVKAAQLDRIDEAKKKKKK